MDTLKNTEEINLTRRVLLSSGGTQRALVLDTTPEPGVIAIGFSNPPDLTLWMHLTKRELLKNVIDLCEKD